MYSIFWGVYFKRKSSELNGSVWGWGREFGSFAVCYSFLCLVWMREWSESYQSISWTVNWLKRRAWLTESELLTKWVWFGPIYSLKPGRIFPFADIKITGCQLSIAVMIHHLPKSDSKLSAFSSLKSGQWILWMFSLPSKDWAVFACFQFFRRKKKTIFQ